MSHVDDGQLNALLDGELSPEETRSVEAHVATCAECSRRLNEARAFLTEAGELLDVMTPPVVRPGPVTAAKTGEPPLVAPVAPGPAPARPMTPAERASGPRLPKTLKEVAISIDGRTAQTPAIRPVLPHEVPAPKKRWELPDLEKLAWAASLVLAIGVGYLANEVYHQRGINERYASSEVAPEHAPTSSEPTATVAPPTATQRATVSDRLGASGATAGAGARADGTGPASSTGQLGARDNRQAAAPSAPAAERRAVQPDLPPRVPKPRTVKRPPGAAQRPVEGIAANTPTDAGRTGRDEAAREQAPLNAPAAGPDARARAAAPTPGAQQAAERNALADTSRAPAASGAGAPVAAPPLAAAPGAESPRAARRLLTSTLDETTVANGDVAGLARTATSFRRVPMEEAVRHLSGSIRLIDGLNPTRVDVGPGRLVAGADPEREVVRVTYADARGRRLVLDQQLGDNPQTTAAFNGLLRGDTLVSTTESGATQVRWVDRKFWLSLTGIGGTEAVRALVERVR